MAKKRIAINEVGYLKHEYPTKGIIRRLIELGHNVFIYKGTERENSLLKIRHFQVYEGFLDFCEKKNIDIAFIDTVVCPEHLLAELKVKKSFKPKVVFLSTFREPARSLARANVFKELIENEYVGKIPMYSLLGNKISPPIYWNELNINKNKYSFIGEPFISEIDDNEKISLMEDIQLPKDEKIGLFFGRDDPSKGLNDLAKTLDLLNENVHIFIVSHGSDYTEEKAFNIERENSTVIYRTIGDNEIRDVYDKSDFVIMPYRKSYEYGGSAILKIAINMNKPIIVPNLYPFSEIINLYKVGLTFEPENITSLSKAINYMSENFNEIKNKANFNDYENLLSTYDKIADLIAEN